MCDTRWLSWADLEQLVEPDTLRRLRPYLHHIGLNGLPCVEADRLDDLLQMLDGEEGES